MAAPTADELALSIENLLPIAWSELHSVPLPPMNDDGRALFRAIARAVVKFFQDHKGDFVTSISLTIPALPVTAAPGSTTATPVTCSVTNVNFNL